MNEKKKYFSVNLYKTKKERRKAKQFGKPKTFFLLHFKDQKIHDVTLDFRESFQSPTEGRVELRVQHINNEKALFSEIIKKLTRREQLILK